MLESLFNKKRLHHRCFPVNIMKFLRIPILKKICERLLLNDDNKNFPKRGFPMKERNVSLVYKKAVARMLSFKKQF